MTGKGIAFLIVVGGLAAFFTLELYLEGVYKRFIARNYGLIEGIHYERL